MNFYKKKQRGVKKTRAPISMISSCWSFVEPYDIHLLCIDGTLMYPRAAEGQPPGPSLDPKYQRLAAAETKLPSDNFGMSWFQHIQQSLGKVVFTTIWTILLNHCSYQARVLRKRKLLQFLAIQATPGHGKAGHGRPVDAQQLGSWNSMSSTSGGGTAIGKMNWGFLNGNIPFFMAPPVPQACDVCSRHDHAIHII